MSFGYDPWANLLSATVTKGDDVPMLSQSVATTNRIKGYCYDAPGNLLAQSAPPCPAPTYTYDAENRMTLTAGVTYTYDGDGRRVKKDQASGSTYDRLYWYGVGSDPLMETDLAGNTNNAAFQECVFFGGRRIAKRDFNSAVNYLLQRPLGRLMTKASGTIVWFLRNPSQTENRN